MHREPAADAETRARIERAQRDLAIFRDGEPMELYLIKDLDLRAMEPGPNPPS